VTSTINARERLATGGLNAPLSPWRIVREPHWLLRDLAPTSVELHRPAEYIKGVALWRQVRQQGFTMLGCRRARTLHRLAAFVERHGVPGAIVDCGVWNGGSSAIMAHAAPTRTVWAFDSFEGLPKPGPEDQQAEGWAGSCLGREDNVREAFRRFARGEQVRIVKGWFADTFPRTRDRIGPIALLHADGDWYDSVKLTLNSLYDRITSGGWMVVDDYSIWSGARMAVDEFRSARAITSPLCRAEASAYWQVR
jgi:O-methyltransferase